MGHCPPQAGAEPGSDHSTLSITLCAPYFRGPTCSRSSLRLLSARARAPADHVGWGEAAGGRRPEDGHAPAQCWLLIGCRALARAPRGRPAAAPLKALPDGAALLVPAPRCRRRSRNPAPTPPACLRYRTYLAANVPRGGKPRGDTRRQNPGRSFSPDPDLPPGPMPSPGPLDRGWRAELSSLGLPAPPSALQLLGSCPQSGLRGEAAIEIGGRGTGGGGGGPRVRGRKTRGIGLRGWKEQEGRVPHPEGQAMSKGGAGKPGGGG